MSWAIICFIIESWLRNTFWDTSFPSALLLSLPVLMLNLANGIFNSPAMPVFSIAFSVCDVLICTSSGISSCSPICCQKSSFDWSCEPLKSMILLVMDLWQRTVLPDLEAPVIAISVPGVINAFCSCSV